MPLVPAHPGGEQASALQDNQPPSAILDTWAGQIRVEWNPIAPLTPFGQLPLFYRISQGIGTVRCLGGGPPPHLHEPERPRSTRRARPPDAVHPRRPQAIFLDCSRRQRPSWCP